MRGHKEMKKREEKKGTLRSQREVQKTMMTVMGRIA